MRTHCLPALAAIAGFAFGVISSTAQVPPAPTSAPGPGSPASLASAVDESVAACRPTYCYLHISCAVTIGATGIRQNRLVSRSPLLCGQVGACAG